MKHDFYFLTRRRNFSETLALKTFELLPGFRFQKVKKRSMVLNDKVSQIALANVEFLKREMAGFVA